jgi:hypothetical protein
MTASSGIYRPIFFAVAILWACLASNLSALSKTTPGLNAKSMNVEIQSNAFQSGQRVPVIYTADGKDLSPPLRWKSGSDKSVRSLALICDDPDAPMGTWVHWVIYNIPPAPPELREGISKQAELSDGSKQGKNSWNKIGYGGPSPPPGKLHHYHFKLYALDQTLPLQAEATKEQLVSAMQGHILGQAELIGVYSR